MKKLIYTTIVLAIMTVVAVHLLTREGGNEFKVFNDKSALASGIRIKKPVRGSNSQRVLGFVKRFEQKKSNRIVETMFGGKVVEGEGSLSKNPHTLGFLEVALENNFVRTILAGESGLFEIPLPDGPAVTLEVTGNIVRGESTVSLVGKVQDDPHSEMLMVFNEEAVAGSLTLDAGSIHYEFGMAGDGDVVIRRLDPGTFMKNCGCGKEHGQGIGEGEGDELLLEYRQTTRSFQDSGARTVIDTVVGYDRAARIADGGVAAIEARIIASVDRMNLALENSRVDDIEVVLVGTIEDSDYVFPGAIDGNMGSSDELGDLRNPVDGSLDVVQDLREELGADHVCFVVSEADGYAGIAYRPGSSMICARTYMSSAGIVFAHELGHNIGCGHAWGDRDADLGRNTTETGWRFVTPNIGARRTIMAYSSLAKTTNFSNPDVMIDGVATGAVTGYDASADASVDPNLVSGGLVGDGGSGFDGTNPNLGADNALSIRAKAWILAGNDSRPSPKIQLENPLDNALANVFGEVGFTAGDFADVVTETFTIRNIAGNDLEGLGVSLERNDNQAFSVGSLGTSTLATNGTTTFQVSFSPVVAEEEDVRLRIFSFTAGVPDMVVTLRGTYDPPVPEIEVSLAGGEVLASGAANILFSSEAAGEKVSRILTVSNKGQLDLSGLAASFEGNGNSTFSTPGFDSVALPAGAATGLEVSFISVAAGLESVVLVLTSNDPATPSFRIPLAGSLDGPIYAESFEDGFGIWTNTGERDWQERTGRTPSGLTGPNGAADGSTYLYVEATGNTEQTFSLEANFDLSGHGSAKFGINYHMYGNSTGSLHVDVFDGVWHNSVWSLSGQQHAGHSDHWKPAEIDLSAFTGGNITIRVRARTLNQSRGDISVDAFEISAEPVTFLLNYSADEGGGSPDLQARLSGRQKAGRPWRRWPRMASCFSSGATDPPKIPARMSQWLIFP